MTLTHAVNLSYFDVLNPLIDQPIYYSKTRDTVWLDLVKEQNGNGIRSKSYVKYLRPPTHDASHYLCVFVVVCDWL